MNIKKQIISTVLIFSIILSLFSNMVYASNSTVNDKFVFKARYNIENHYYNVYQKHVDDSSLLNTVYYDINNNQVVTEHNLINKLKIISFVNMYDKKSKNYLINNVSKSFKTYCDEGSLKAFQHVVAMKLADHSGLFAGNNLTGMNYTKYYTALQKGWSKMDKEQRLKNLATISETFMCAYISLSFTNSQSNFKEVISIYDKYKSGIVDYDTAYSIYKLFVRANDLFNAAYLFESSYLKDKLPDNISDSVQKVVSKMVDSGAKEVSSMQPDKVDIELINNMGTYKDSYKFISELITDKENLDMFLTILSYVGSGNEKSSTLEGESVGESYKVEMSVLLTEALQIMINKGKYSKQAVKFFSDNISPMAEYVSLITTSITPLLDNIKYSYTNNIRYSRGNYDLYQLHSSKDASGHIIYNGIELMIEQHTDWSGLYETGQANFDWDWRNVSNKLIWVTDFWDIKKGDNIIGLTNDGLYFIAGKFCNKNSEYIKQNGLKYLGDNQVILATGIKSVENKGRFKLLTKFDETILQGFDEEIVKGDVIQIMGNIALKKDGTLWNTYSNDVGKILKEEVPFTKVASNVKQIIVNDEERFVLKNDGSVWGWKPIYDSDNRIEKEIPKKLLSNIVKIKTMTSYYEHKLYTYAIDTKGVLWKGNSTGFKKLMDKVTDVYNQESTCQHIMSIYVLKNNGNLYEFYKDEIFNSNPAKVKFINKTDKILEDVESITTDGDVFMVIKKDKSLWSWGDNINGAFGDGTEVNKPKKILNSVKWVTIKSSVVCAIKEEGSLWEWGDILFKIDGKFSDSSIPTNIISDVKYFNPYSSSNIVIKNNGSVWTWGYETEDYGVIKDNEPKEFILE